MEGAGLSQSCSAYCGNCPGHHSVAALKLSSCLLQQQLLLLLLMLRKWYHHVRSVRIEGVCLSNTQVLSVTCQERKKLDSLFLVSICALSRRGGVYQGLVSAQRQRLKVLVSECLRLLPGLALGGARHTIDIKMLLELTAGLVVITIALTPDLRDRGT